MQRSSSGEKGNERRWSTNEEMVNVRYEKKFFEPVNVCVNELLTRMHAMVTVSHSPDLAGRLERCQSTSSRRHLRALEGYI